MKEKRGHMQQMTWPAVKNLIIFERKHKYLAYLNVETVVIRRILRPTSISSDFFGKDQVLLNLAAELDNARAIQDGSTTCVKRL